MCRNPLLAAERKRKRDALLAATERDLSRIRQAVLRKRAPLRGEAEIGLAVGAVLDKHKMGKHFEIAMTDASLVYRRTDNTIAAEACLDGIYVIRTNVPKEALSPEETVGAYKALAQVERAFRSIKTVDPNCSASDRECSQCETTHGRPSSSSDQWLVRQGGADSDEADSPRDPEAAHARALNTLLALQVATNVDVKVHLSQRRANRGSG